GRLGGGAVVAGIRGIGHGVKRGGSSSPAASSLATPERLPTSAALPALVELLAALLGAPAVRLARLDALRVAPAVELLLGRVVAILDAATILRIVLPLRLIAALALLVVRDALVGDIRPVDVVREASVVVDVDVHVAAPPVAVAPERAPDRHAYAERERGRAERVAGRVRIGRRVRGVRPRTVDDGRIVGGHVDHLGIGRLDLDHGGGLLHLHGGWRLGWQWLDLRLPRCR